MKTERRWLKSVLAASAQPLPPLPWERAARHGAAPSQPAPTAKPQIAV